MKDKAIDVINKLHKDSILSVALESLVLCGECPLIEEGIDCVDNCGEILIRMLNDNYCRDDVIDYINRSIDKYESRNN